MQNEPTTRAARWLVLSLLSALCPAIEAAAAPAGAQIVNIASVRYTTGSTGFTSASNPVTTPVSGVPGLSVVKSADPAGSVPPGTQVTFRLAIENPASVAVTDAVVSDALDPLLGPPAGMSTGAVPNNGPGGGTIVATASYAIATHTVQWTLPTIPAKARFVLSFVSQISPAAPDDSVVLNASTQSSAQDPNGTVSNEVRVGVVAPALSIAKQASRSRAEVGEPVGFTVDLSNISPTIDLHAAVVREQAPPGFVYLEGSARLDGRRIPDPAGSPGGGRRLLFPLGDLPRGLSRRLTYVAIPTAEAEGRDGLGTSWGEALTPSGSPVLAGPAEAGVRIAGSLLSSEAVVMGRVFVDDNRNGLFDEGEVGVPSARVYLEDGTFTLTDVVGKYHIEGVRPGLHTLKIDTMTLPDGLGPFASWSRSAGGAGTQFVDVGGDQLFKSNIATGGWGISVARLIARGLYRDPQAGGPARARVDDEGLREVVFPPLLASAVFPPEGVTMRRSARTVVEGYASMIRERGGRLVSVEVEPVMYPLADEGLMRARAAALSGEMSRLLLAAAPATAPAPGDDETGRTARRAIPDGGPPPGIVAASTEGEGDRDAAAAVSTRAEPGLEDLEASVSVMSAEPAILTPADGATLAAERAKVEVKLPAGLEPRLTINGDIVANEQIAVRVQTSETSRSRLVFYRYIGPRFKEGRNSIVLEGLDQWGNARAWVERVVLRVGAPRHVALHPDDAGLTADARTPIEVTIDVRDAEGLPVADGTLVTVEADAGQFLGTDASTQEDGFQTVTAGGVARVHLAPVSIVEKRRLSARAGDAAGETVVSLGPDLRRWIVTGVGEGTLGSRGTTQGASLSDALGGSAADGRFALFARGRLFGTSLMTLSFDSQRERDRDQLFRRLAPDRYFPIYGDGSEQRYDVEGQGKFSLRLDQARSTLRLGDFTTGLAGGDLLRYERALTGGAGRVELKGFSLQSFGATTPQTQTRDEIPGAGISGPYRVTRRPLIANSERVTLETRDRYHPERLIASRAMARYADYDIDYAGGSLFFKQPVPFQDDDFNPVVVVATYETLDGNGQDTVAGGRVGYRFGQGAEMGTTYVSEGRDGGAYVLRGVDFGARRRVGATSFEMSGEAASSQLSGSGASGAYSFRTGARFGETMGLSAYYRNVAAGFSNPSRAGSSDTGTVRWGLEGQATLADSSRLKGEFYSQTDSLRGQDRRVGSIDWERVMGKLTARSGFKDLTALDPRSGEEASARLLSAGLGVRLSERLEAQVGRQQVLSGAALQEYPTRTSLGLGCKLTDDISGFLREEYDQADAGQSSRTVVGLESHLTRNTVMESRYSLEDALNGSRGLAQLGLRTRLTLNQDWLGDASLERVETTGGTASGDFTALGLGFEYLPARVKFTTRYELRLGDASDAHVLTAAGATRLSESLSLFSRNRIFLVAPRGGAARLDGDGLLGLAYRPVSSDRLNFLVKLQGLKGAGAAGTGSPEARSYLGILETNYQAAPKLHLLGRLAFKESRDQFEGDSYLSHQRLGEGRLLYDIGDRVNAGLTVRLLDQPTVGSRLTGYGLEAGYRLARDLVVVTGYNVTGFAAGGFGDTERRAAGPFVTLRFKFDEETLAGLSRGLAGAGGRRGPAAQPSASE